MNKFRLFVLGDSISMQYGPFLERFTSDWFDYSRKTGDHGFSNLDNPMGANGGDSSMVLEYLTGCSASRFTTDYLLLNCGLHDVKTDPATGEYQVGMDQYRKNVAASAAFAVAIARTPIWITTTPVVDEIHNSRIRDFHRHAKDVVAYNTIAREVALRSGMPVIDLHGFTMALGSAQELFADHVHFVESVQERQAAFIAGFLAGVIQKDQNSSAL